MEPKLITDPKLSNILKDLDMASYGIVKPIK